MGTEQLERIGDYMTIREAARVKGTTPNALYLWLYRSGKPISRVGKSLVVR